VQNQGLGRNPADPNGLPLGFDPLADKGPATHDQRHRFVLSGMVRLPLDFQFSSIITAASGRPFNALAGRTSTATATAAPSPDRRAPQPGRPDHERRTQQ